MVLSLGLVAWLGAERAIQRFSMLESHDVSLARRISMARGGLQIFKDHPFEGTGLGTLVSVYPRYETVYDGKVVDHVHNDYVELLADNGIIGGLCGLAFLGLLFQKGQKNLAAQQSRLAFAIHAGAAVALIGILFHSFVDFNLHIPANALLFLLQAHMLAVSLPSPKEGPRRQGRKQSSSTSDGESTEVGQSNRDSWSHA